MLHFHLLINNAEYCLDYPREGTERVHGLFHLCYIYIEHRNLSYEIGL